jgi:hypothetical protein
MRTLSACLFAAALSCLFAPAANANAIYSFSGNIVGPNSNVGNFSIAITVTDAIANGGSFNFHVVGAGGFGGCVPTAPTNCFITGDPTGFVSLTESRGETFAFPNNILGTLDLAFAVSGGVASGFLNQLGAYTDLTAGFEPAGLSGTIYGDGLELACPDRQRCTLSPAGSAVPEPSTWVMLLAALGFLFFVMKGGLAFKRR